MVKSVLKLHQFTHSDELVVFQLDDVSHLDVHPFLAPQSENRKQACVCICVNVPQGSEKWYFLSRSVRK